MDYIRFSPEDFAALGGLDKGSFIRACRKGKTRHAGWPIGDWVVREENGRTVSHLRIPAEEVEQLLDLEKGTLSEPEEKKTEPEWTDSDRPEPVSRQANPSQANPSQADSSQPDSSRANPSQAGLSRVGVPQADRSQERRTSGEPSGSGGRADQTESHSTTRDPPDSLEEFAAELFVREILAAVEALGKWLTSGEARHGSQSQTYGNSPGHSLPRSQNLSRAGPTGRRVE